VIGRLGAMALTLVLVTACGAINRMAVNVVGNSLSAGGTVFASDPDPDLVREAVPFGLKTYESLLAVSPKHEGLLLAAASGFASYAYLLEQEALLADGDIATVRQQRERASRLYLRGRDYALRGLALRDESFVAHLRGDPEAALAKLGSEQVPFLYWAGVTWAAALGADKSSPLLLAELPIAAALVHRVLELDPEFDAGAAHEFLVSYEASRPGGDLDAARLHYTQALALQRGNKASLHLALAEGVCVNEQNVAEFRTLAARAMAVDLDAEPEWRVVNALAQRRAAWLVEHLDEFFIDTEIL